jgi:hypothetical protein
MKLKRDDDRAMKSEPQREQEQQPRIAEGLKKKKKKKQIATRCPFVSEWWLSVLL